MGRDDLTMGRKVVPSSVVRVPSDAYIHAKAMAGMTQRSPGSLLADAWWEYVENHREEFERDFDTIGHLLRDSDTEGLVEFMKQGAQAEADAMMRAAGRK